VPDHLLPLPDETDPATRGVVATLTAALDDQLLRLERALADLSVEALEWQSAPGMNSIGMLAVHLALVEVWWITVAPAGDTSFQATDGRFREVLGIGANDDGIGEGESAFPEALRGKTAADYVALLRTARAAVRPVLASWTDADLARTVTGRRGTVSYRWILYHVLEHFAAHLGQVMLVRHQLRDAGLLPKAG
jgi:uncharacterized damage-inducible protein DinB